MLEHRLVGDHRLLGAKLDVTGRRKPLQKQLSPSRIEQLAAANAGNLRQPVLVGANPNLPSRKREGIEGRACFSLSYGRGSG
jgi:hypothetical protein